LSNHTTYEQQERAAPRLPPPLDLFARVGRAGAGDAPPRLFYDQTTSVSAPRALLANNRLTAPQWCGRCRGMGARP